jgi:hypothetical protein
MSMSANSTNFRALKALEETLGRESCTDGEAGGAETTINPHGGCPTKERPGGVTAQRRHNERYNHEPDTSSQSGHQ